MIARARGRVVLDLRDVGRNHRGVSRCLREIGRRLLALDPERYFAVCSKSGAELLPGAVRDRVAVLPPHSQAVFEQVTLPAIATRLGARVVYSHRECGAMWGPQLLLHVPEDPEIRWRRDPLHLTTPQRGKASELARRGYSRLLMNRALQRARVVTSTRATALDLECRHRLPADRVTVVPLGIDLEQFHPVAGAPTPEVPYLFHLSSEDPREGTVVVVEAFATFVRRTSDPIRLVVAGELGAERQRLLEHTARLGIGDLVDTPGRVSDERLVELYAGAAATVIASTNEGFGLQPLEAMACGSLLVAAAAPATKEVVGHGDVEWTEVAIGPMADAFDAVVRDRTRQRRARRFNREAANRYSWDATAQRLDTILSEMGSPRSEHELGGGHSRVPPSRALVAGDSANDHTWGTVVNR